MKTLITEDTSKIWEKDPYNDLNIQDFDGLENYYNESGLKQTGREFTFLYFISMIKDEVRSVLAWHCKNRTDMLCQYDEWLMKQYQLYIKEESGGEE